MPWCEECAKYWTPNSMNDDGTCPACGRVVEAPDVATGTGDPSSADTTTDERAPWHFKLLVGSMAVYLAWRVYTIFA